MFSYFKTLFNKKTEKDIIDAYLADSVDLVDLENRIRKIDRNEAPWQIKANQSFAGWV